jgi:hypothetical protein
MRVQRLLRNRLLLLRQTVQWRQLNRAISFEWRCRRNSRWRRTSGHSLARMLYITMSRAVPSRRVLK